MNQYVTGAMIRRLREEKRITQQQLADRLGVSGKAVSKWETGRGYPDITLIEPLAAALGPLLADSGHAVLAGIGVEILFHDGLLAMLCLYCDMNL